MQGDCHECVYDPCHLEQDVPKDFDMTGSQEDKLMGVSAFKPVLRIEASRVAHKTMLDEINYAKGKGWKRFFLIYNIIMIKIILHAYYY